MIEIKVEELPNGKFIVQVDKKYKYSFERALGRLRTLGAEIEKKGMLGFAEIEMPDENKYTKDKIRKFTISDVRKFFEQYINK